MITWKIEFSFTLIFNFLYISEFADYDFTIFFIIKVDTHWLLFLYLICTNIGVLHASTENFIIKLCILLSTLSLELHTRDDSTNETYGLNHNEIVFKRAYRKISVI